jgi:hypothetical protein
MLTLSPDSRPDFAPQSTDTRMQRSVLGGLEFIHVYLRPAAIITQGKSWEDPFFWNGVIDYATESGTAHIGLSAASTHLMWIASVDSSALQGIKSSRSYPPQFLLMCNINSLE